MTITRRSLADLIDAYDEEIKGANEAKAEEYRAYRDQLEKAGYTKERIANEITACKAAIRKRQKINAGKPIEEQDELVDQVLFEIGASRGAHTREEAA